MADKKNFELNEDDLDKAAGGVSVNNIQFTAGTVGYTGTTFTFGGVNKDQEQAQGGGTQGPAYDALGGTNGPAYDALGGTQGNDVSSINTMNPLNTNLDM